MNITKPCIDCAMAVQYPEQLPLATYICEENHPICGSNTCISKHSHDKKVWKLSYLTILDTGEEAVIWRRISVVEVGS